MFPAAVAVVVLYLVAYFTIPSLPLPSYSNLVERVDFNDSRVALLWAGL